MTKLIEQVQILRDTEVLLAKMIIEIDTLRNILKRYHLRHGEEIEDGTVNISDNICFYLKKDTDSKFLCRMIDNKELGLSSNYQDIKKGLNKLI